MIIFLCIILTLDVIATAYYIQALNNKGSILNGAVDLVKDKYRALFKEVNSCEEELNRLYVQVNAQQATQEALLDLLEVRVVVTPSEPSKTVLKPIKKEAM